MLSTSFIIYKGMSLGLKPETVTFKKSKQLHKIKRNRVAHICNQWRNLNVRRRLLRRFTLIIRQSNKIKGNERVSGTLFVPSISRLADIVVRRGCRADNSGASNFRLLFCAC
jgi:hypothetical protein